MKSSLKEKQASPSDFIVSKYQHETVILGKM